MATKEQILKYFVLPPGPPDAGEEEFRRLLVLAGERSGDFHGFWLARLVHWKMTLYVEMAIEHLIDRLVEAEDMVALLKYELKSSRSTPRF